MRTIDWVAGAIELVDQTRLPGELTVLRVEELDQLVGAIQRLAVRGAPALGVAGALGVALLAQSGRSTREVRQDAALLRAARPTAANLAWGVDRALGRLDEGPAVVLAEALAVRDEDIAACVSMGRHGADLVDELVPGRRVDAMTICNTGGLAAVERGTALGVLQTLHERDRLNEVLVSETRPLLQGARLTAWELRRMGARHHVVVDSAAAYLLASGRADVVVVGADRIAANGDTANKIGTVGLALAARHAGVPFVVVAPESTIDERTATGERIEIEYRADDEVLAFHGVSTASAGTSALNPAFDVTPASLVTAIVTDRRVIRCGDGESPAGRERVGRP